MPAADEDSPPASTAAATAVWTCVRVPVHRKAVCARRSHRTTTEVCASESPPRGASSSTDDGCVCRRRDSFPSAVATSPVLLLLFVCLTFVLWSACPSRVLVAASSSGKRRYVNQMAVLVNGGPARADAIARSHGYVNIGKIMQDQHYYLFEDARIKKRSTRKKRHVSSMRLTKDPQVLWAQQQQARIRVKRDDRRTLEQRRLRRQHWPYYHQQQPISRPTPSRQQPHHAKILPGGEPARWSNRNHFDALLEENEEQEKVALAVATPARKPNDPLWPDMWYLHRSDRPGLDHNVREAWEMGYTGRGVVVTILDDGLERTHPDIEPNYDEAASLDINDHDRDPTPRYDHSDENRHGTRCAGEVAAIFNNSLCIVGIAFNAKIGGIRMLDGDVTDAVEAASLSHNRDHIDIYSASWGPDDDGRTVDGPARLAKSAFLAGIKNGRNKKGSIFVWASGNGGKDADSCNCDGYTNSIYTLSISSATEHGNVPWYSEACSSTLASTYSSGASGEKMVVTTDLHHSCTNTHTGTSASAPLAAGVAALALEANPQLTWRDMQHIVVRTANPQHLRARDWVTNGVGRNVSHSFGFGLMDAGAMVKMAKNWTRVPPQHICTAKIPDGYHRIEAGRSLHVQITSNGCASDERRRVRFVEHVQAEITLTAPKRGDIRIFLTSPAGTRSTLLAKRTRDASRAGFRRWAFMTTHNWGEAAAGKWTIQIDNDGWDNRRWRRRARPYIPHRHRHTSSETEASAHTLALLKNFTLVIYGTAVEPQAATTGEKALFRQRRNFSDESIPATNINRSLQEEANLIEWKLHLRGTPFKVGDHGGVDPEDVRINSVAATTVVSCALLLGCLLLH